MIACVACLLRKQRSAGVDASDTGSEDTSDLAHTHTVSGTSGCKGKGIQEQAAVLCVGVYYEGGVSALSRLTSLLLPSSAILLRVEVGLAATPEKQVARLIEVATLIAPLVRPVKNPAGGKLHLGAQVAVDECSKTDQHGEENYTGRSWFSHCGMASSRSLTHRLGRASGRNLFKISISPVP